MKKLFQNWRQLLSVQIGGAICLPIIIIGQAIGSMFGFLPSLLVIGLGNLFLMGIAIMTSIMSVRKRKSTSEIAKEYFGKRGAKFFSTLLSFSLIGWFGIQLNFIVQSLLQVLALVGISIVFSPIILNIALGIIMTVCALFGLKSIRMLASLTIPLLIGVLIFALFSAPLSTISLTGLGAAISLQGISMVIGGAISGVIDFPTYFQHAKNKKHAVIAAVLLFGLALPFIEIVGVCLGVCFPASTVLTCLIAGGGLIWSLCVTLFLIFAGWTTNNTNIYSAAVNSKGICPKIPRKIRTLIFGLLGTLLSSFGLLGHLEIILTIMGILLGSMGATTLASFLMDKFLKSEITNKGQIFNLISFALAIMTGLSTFFGIFTFTYLPILDAFLTALILTVGFRFLSHKKVIMKEIADETN